MDPESMDAYFKEERRESVEHEEMKRVMIWAAEYEGNPNNIKSQMRSTLRKLKIDFDESK